MMEVIEDAIAAPRPGTGMAPKYPGMSLLLPAACMSLE